VRRHPGWWAALLGLSSLAPLLAAVSPTNDILAMWQAGPGGQGLLDPKHVELLQEAGVTAVLLPWPAGGATERFVKTCKASGITPFAYLGAPSGLAAARNASDRARAAGFTGLALDAGGAFATEDALRAFLAAQPKALDVLVFLTPEQIHWRVAAACAVLRAGQWPGVRGSPAERPDAGVASASREPWIDSNAHLIAYLRALFPDRPAFLGYRPDEAAGVSADRLVPSESLELGLIEAFVAGGNFVLSLPETCRAALVAGEAEALAAWRSLGQTVAFLKQHAETFRRPGAARVAVAAGTLEQSGGILNMMYRRNSCPVVFAASAIPALDPGRFRALVAANLPPPEGVHLERIFAYARAGGLVITAPAAPGRRAWWLDAGGQKTRIDEDRDFYSVGKGRIIAYRKPIKDPSEFALDVIDALGVRTRDLRLWNAGPVIGWIHRLAENRLSLELINYGPPRKEGFPARVEGIFRTATFLEPGAPGPRSLKAVKRGTATEVTVDRLNRLALIVLE